MSLSTGTACCESLPVCSGGGPTSFRKFKDEAAYPHGGAPLKPYPGPPYMSGTDEAREVEMNTPGGSTQGLHLVFFTVLPWVVSAGRWELRHASYSIAVLAAASCHREPGEYGLSSGVQVCYYVGTNIEPGSWRQRKQWQAWHARKSMVHGI